MGISVTITVDESSIVTLDGVATGRAITREALIEEAIAGYAAFEAEQLAKMRDGIAAADRGDFASDAEVGTVFAKYRA